MVERNMTLHNESNLSNTSIMPKHAGQNPLSCTHCRHRKVKCNRIHPCLPCQRLGLECVFPERAKSAKKKRNGTKATTEELLARLSRMEQLIGTMEGDVTNVKEEPKQSPPLNTACAELPRKSSLSSNATKDHEGSASPTDGLNRYIGSTFWRSLTSEVEGLRQAVDEDSEEEGDSPASIQSIPGGHSSHSSVMFGSSYNTSQNLRHLHPPVSHISSLCEFYLNNVDTVFKILHAPTLRKLVASFIANFEHISTNNHIEALLFAMYYGAITSLDSEQCFRMFQDGRESLLTKYRAGTERALANADFLNTTELGTLQALLMFLITVRSNDDSQFAWTLTATAVRLAQSMGLNREASSSGMSPFMVEMRRRLWWQLIVLDLRCSEDRATDPMIVPSLFNTRRPLNINDSDIWPEIEAPPPERVGFTEMTKCTVSHEICHLKAFFGQVGRFDEDGGNLVSPLPFEERLKVLSDVEKRLHDKVLVHCDSKVPIAWSTSIVTRLVMCRIRLMIYHPIEDGSGNFVRPNVPRERLLETAVANLEYSHLLDVEPAGAQWRWFTKTYVQWHALATTLTELCVQTKGPLVKRAWRIVDAIFEVTAARIADSRNGLLWRPMKKLMARAQAKRKETETANVSTTFSEQQPLPQFDSLAFNEPNLISPPVNSPSSTDGIDLNSLNQPSLTETQFPPNGLSVSNDQDSNAINWTEWDTFMQDFEMEAPSKDAIMAGLQPNFAQPDMWY